MRRLTGILVNTSIALLVLVALIVSALRLTFPYLNDFRESIAHQIESISGIPVEIGYLEGEWLSFGPSLKINRLRVHQEEYNLDVNEITFELDVWRSLLNFRWQFRDLTFYQLRLKINNNPEDSFDSDFKITPGSVGDIFLRQINYFDLKDSDIAFFSPSNTPISFHVSNLTWLNKRARHQAEGEVVLTGLQDNLGELKVILDLMDDSSGLLSHGMVYLQANDVNMKPWLSRLVRDNTGLENVDFSLASWIRLENRQIEEGYLRLNNGDVSWTTPDSRHRLDIDEQWLHLTKRLNGWQLVVPQLNISSDGKRWPNGNVSLYWQPEHKPDENGEEQSEILRIRATQLQLEYLKQILPIFTFLDPDSIAPWLELNPEGNLTALALDIPLKQAEQLKFIAKWSDVSWLPWRKLPGVDHFDGYAEGNLNQGYVRVNLHNSTLPYDSVFRAPLEISQASGQLYWTNNNDRLKLWSDSVDVQARSLWINGDFAYSSSEEQGTWLSILAGIHLDDAKDAWRYYPEPLMGKSLVDYLTDAIQGGHTRDAALIFEGDPNEFPFPKKNGRFQVFVPLRDATLQFQPTWQPLTNLSINLDFVDNGLWMRAKDAKLVNVDAPQILASIPAYDLQKLYLDADIHGSGNAVYEYLKDSPLRDSVAAALEQVQISGNVNGHLRLEIPLAPNNNGDVDVAASGNINLDNNDILIKPVNLVLNKAKGSFNFTNETIDGNKLDADWFGQPIKLSFDTKKMANDYRINVDLSGNWALSKLPILSGSLANDFKGQANWQSHIAITLPNQGINQYDISLQSRVTKVSEYLSSLLGSKKDEPVAVKLRAKGNTNQFNLTGTLGNNHINSLWLLGDNEIRVARGVWQTNVNRQPALPKDNVLTVNLPEINGDYWLPLLVTQASNQDNTKQAGTSLIFPERVELTSPAITFAGQRWRQMDIELSRTSSSSRLVIDGDELKATLITASLRPWQVNVERLYYNPVWPESVNLGTKTVISNSRTAISGQRAIKKVTRDLPVTSFRNWPALAIRCNDCWFMGQRFGKLEADLQPAGMLLRLTHGLIDTGNTKLLITGQWQSSLREVSSRFVGSLSGDRIDRSLRHFGVLTPLKGAPFMLDFDVAWQGEPWSPHLETLNGLFSSELGQGAIANMGGGTAGLILRLVSITALLKQLQFDFSDSFGDNFDFGSIRATGKINNGILSTNDLYINGSSADIGMAGTVDLARQTINMEAVVAPELSATVGVATAFVVNPVAGVAVFAATKVLAPLWNKVSFIRYQITGTFDAPEVSEILRQASKEK